MNRTSTVLVGLLAVAGAGCEKNAAAVHQRQAGPDRATALALIKSHTDQEFIGRSTGFLPAEWNEKTDARTQEAYRALVKAGVLDCATSESGTRCRPGAMSEHFMRYDALWRNISFNVGIWDPIQVTGITSTGTNTADAEVQISLLRVPPYAGNERDFNRVASWVVDYKETQVGAEGRFPMLSDDTTGDRLISAKFRKFDDGWRLERLVK